MGVSEVKPHQTVAVDFREYRDRQTPDAMGNVIPLNVDKGQIGWSVRGAANKTLSGRSEQISLSKGVASTYACANCCPDSVYNANIMPDWIELDFGSSGFMAPMQTDITCNQTLFGPYTIGGANWDSDNVNVVTVSGGELFTQGVGTATIFATWETCLWWLGGSSCSPVCDQIIQYGSVAVASLVAITKADGSALPSPFRVGMNGGGNDRKQNLKATVSPTPQISNISIQESSKLTLTNVQTVDNLPFAWQKVVTQSN